MSKTLTIKGYVIYDNFWARHGDDSGGYVDGFTFTTFGLSTDKEKVLVGEHSIQIEVPEDFDPRPGMVKNLEAQKEQARAEFAAKVTSIDRQINELLALEA